MTYFRNSDRPLDTSPIEPLDPRPVGYWSRRFEFALTALIVLAVTIWAVSF